MRPIIINNFLHSARILADGCEKFLVYSVEGTTWNSSLMSRSPVMEQATTAFVRTLAPVWTCHGQRRKSRSTPWASCWVDLNSQRFHPIAEASELPDHSRSACSLQPFADDLAAFLVAVPSIQDYPDEPTEAIGNFPNGLIVSQALYDAAIHDLEDASFRPDRISSGIVASPEFVGRFRSSHSSY
jgi:hypothetical protein